MAQTNIIETVIKLFGRTVDVASAAGVSEPTVRNWLKDGYVKRSKDTVKLARALMARGTPIDFDVLAGETGMTPEPPPVRGRGRKVRCFAGSRAVLHKGSSAGATPAARLRRIQTGSRRA